jgi:glycosyltransferase involved in cell wall biosynthesis
MAGFLDVFPSQVEEISRFADVHAVIEVSPRAWGGNALDLPHLSLPYGVHNAKEHLRGALPAEVWRKLEGCAGLWYAVYPPLWHPGTLSVARAVSRLVRDVAPGIVHLNGESLRSVAWLPGRETPCIYGMHEPRVPTGSYLPRMAIAQRLLISRADRLIVHSEACREAVTRRWSIASRLVTLAPLGPLDVFRAWCELEPPESRPLSSPRVVLWGRLGPRKGIETYLEGARIASSSLHGVRFVLAGACITGYSLPVPPTLENACEFDVLPRQLRNAELCQLVSAASLVVVPYTDAMQSGVALTAFAFGKPVVGSATGGLVDQIAPGVTGELFYPGDAHALAAVLVRLLGDPCLLQKMTAAIEEQWDPERCWSMFGKAVRNAYAELLGDSV